MPSDRAYGPTTPAPRCEGHTGLHVVWQGHCYALGGQVVRPYEFRGGRCETCGQSVDVRRDKRTGEVETLDEGSDRRHVHAAPVVVQLDEDTLAVALGTAVKRLLEHREPPPSQPPSQPPIVASSQPKEPPSPSRNGTLGSIPRFES